MTRIVLIVGLAIATLLVASAIVKIDIVAAGQQNDAIRVSNLRADMEFLSSGALEGRLSLQRGADVAAQFIMAEFRKAGLKPANGDSFLQEFPVISYRTDSTSTQMLLHRSGATELFKYGSEFRSGFHGSVTIKAPLVFAGYGITAPEYGYDDYAEIDVSGKIVLIFDHEPQENNSGSIFNGTGHTRHGNTRVKYVNAQRHGAVAVLLAGEPNRRHRGRFDPPLLAADKQTLRGTAPAQALDDELRIPVFIVSDALAAKLLIRTGKTPAQLQESIDRNLKPASVLLPNTLVEMRNVNAEQKRVASANVAGLLEGSDPVLKNETVLLTAHYDHLGVINGKFYPGANDNASGTAAVMELARAFARSPVKPKRSILFIAFGSEEEGLLGSFYYRTYARAILSEGFSSC